MSGLPGIGPMSMESPYPPTQQQTTIRVVTGIRALSVGLRVEYAEIELPAGAKVIRKFTEEVKIVGVLGR
jgi:hypothetical protein